MPSFVINSATAGDATLGAGEPNRKLGLTSLALIASGAQTITLKTETPGSETASLSGPMVLAANVPFVLPFAPPASEGQRPGPYLETLAGDYLILTLAASVQVSGFGTYSASPV